MRIVAPAPVEDGDDLVDLVVPAEVDGGIRLLKRLEAGIGSLGEREIASSAFLLQPAPAAAGRLRLP